MRLRAIRSPDPAIMLAGVKSGEIEKTKVLAAPFLFAVLEDFMIDGVKYTIKSFTFSLTDSLTTKSIDCEGYKLNEEALKLIENSKSGDKISFYHISVIGPDGTANYVKELNLTIK
ncbi:MAG: GldM family protein [Bacteroidota bacterium]